MSRIQRGVIHGINKVCTWYNNVFHIPILSYFTSSLLTSWDGCISHIHTFIFHIVYAFHLDTPLQNANPLSLNMNYTTGMTLEDIAASTWMNRWPSLLRLATDCRIRCAVKPLSSVRSMSAKTKSLKLRRQVVCSRMGRKEHMAVVLVNTELSLCVRPGPCNESLIETEETFDPIPIN